MKDAEVSHKAVLKLGNMLKWEVEGKFEDIMNQSLETEVIEALQNDPDGLTINNLMSILSVEYKPLYRLLLTLEKENKVNVSRVGKYHTKVYSLENEWKTKMENEKSDASNGNDSENAVMEASFSKTPKSEKRNEQVENEAPKSSFSKNDLPEKMENEHHSDTCDCDQCCPFKDIPEVIS